MPESFLTIYRASAGSGKTHTLTVEYIARLLATENPCHRNILAMTFTNKATAEMKMRIMMRLFDISVGKNVEFMKDVLKFLPELDSNLLQKRAKAALIAIIHDYDHFLVQTIDSFFQRMLTSLAHELGLSANFRVEVNDAEVASLAVDAMLESLLHKPDKKLLNWIKEYVRKNLDDNGGWKIADNIKNFARQNVLGESFQKNKDSYMCFLEDESKVENFLQTIIKMRNSTDKGGGIYDKICREANELYEELQSINNHKHYDKGKYVSKFLGDNSKGTFKFPSKSVNVFLEIPESFTQEKYRDNDKIVSIGCCFINKFQMLVQTIMEMQYIRNSVDKTLDTFNNLRLLGVISQNIDTINTEHNRFLLSRTKWLFSQMVSKSDSPFVFEKMGTQLHHIMIDEFQDTARTQWENIKKLLLENVSKGESCLIVGDVKQSIYRFNGGDWSILANIGNEAGVPVSEHPLKTNYRSLRHIVEFNNSFFLKASEVMDDLRKDLHLLKIYERENTEQEFFKKENTGYVRCTLITDNDKDALYEGENEKLWEDSLFGQSTRLHDMNIAYSDMAILVRWNSEAEKIAEHFSNLHPEIPIVSQEAFMLSASPAVLTIISAMRWLCNKRDTVSLVYCADFFQNQIMKKNIPFSDITWNPQAMVPDELIYGRDILLSTPLYECALQLLKIFCLGNNNKNFTQDNHSAFLTCFFDEILNFLNDGNTELSQFLRHWDEVLSERKIPSAETDGINIVSIHKSKGLAYDTVLLPFCNWDIESPRINSDSYIWTTGVDSPYDALPSYPVRESHDLSFSTYANGYNMELFQRRVENINLLYVAFTRAKSNLLIWGKTKLEQDPQKNFNTGYLLHKVFCNGMSIAEKITSKDKDWYSVYEYGQEPFVSAIFEYKNYNKEKSHNPFIYDVERLPTQMAPSESKFQFMQSSESRRFIKLIDDDAERQEDYIKKGNLYHRIFSEIHSAADVSDAILQVKHEGLINAKEEDAVSNFIRKCLEAPIVKGWFDGSWTVYNECEIICKLADGTVEAKRPDRVMIKNDETVVIDYKFGKPQDEHKQQVGRYMELLRKMGCIKQRGYLWYVYDGKVIEVK